MRTPAGKECRYYYEDYYRGREVHECRLVKENPESARWHPSDCGKCPVPEILNANASKDMKLTLTIKPKFLGFVRQFEVKAYCVRHRIPIEDPHIGCPKCNEERPGLDIFRQALGQNEDD